MVHKKQLPYAKRLVANKIIDLIYEGKISTAKTLIKKNYKPNMELFHFFDGWIKQLEGKYDLSIQAFERALIVNPLNEEVLVGLAGSYLELGDYERAEECASHAVTLNSREPKNLLTLATVLSKSNPKNKKVQREADYLFEKAFEYISTTITTNNKLLVDTLAGWGGCLLNLEEIAQAKLLLEQAILHDFYHPVAHKNLVSVYANLNELDKAINSCKIAQMSDDTNLVLDTIYQEGMLEILRGNYAKGWRLHEARLETEKYNYKDLLIRGNKKLSEVTEHDNVLLFQEQGIGDLLQFCHLIPKIHSMCENIDIVVLPNTFLPMVQGKVSSPKEFIEHNLKGYIRKVYVRGIDQIPNNYDCVTPIMSLAYWIKLTPSNNPGILPFKAEPLNKYTNKIGLFWKGSVHHANDSLRSVPIEYINNLIEKNTDLEFVSLQIDRDDGLGTYKNLISAKDDMNGLLETSSVLQDCSLIITVDSMIAHLAAGLGKPVIILHAWSPDWRWGLPEEKGRGAKPNRWYKHTTDVVQSQYKNWDTVFSDINNRLELFKMYVD